MPVIERFEYSFTVPVGLVIRSEPAEGEDYIAGQDSVIYISLGPQSLSSPTQARITHRAPSIAIGMS